MADEAFRIFELSLQGFSCSQVLAIMALEARGQNNPVLVRAMAGLAGGLGSGRTCGILSGACCVLGLYAGRGATDEVEDGALSVMLMEMTDWFEETYGTLYGGTDCSNIIGHDMELRITRCPQMVVDSFLKMNEILSRNGYSADGRKAGQE